LRVFSPISGETFDKITNDSIKTESIRKHIYIMTICFENTLETHSE
jgi:hypothetical protein